MKKILKIMAIVLIVAVVGLGIYAAASFNPLVPVSNPPIFRAAYAVEKTKYEYDEAITFNLMLYVQKEEYIKGGNLEIKIEESPYYEIDDKETTVVENIRDDEYRLGKSDKYPIVVPFTIRVTENTHGVVPVVVKAKFDYDDTLSNSETIKGVPHYYEGEEYFYGFDSLMFIADDFGVWFDEDTKDHNLIDRLRHKMSGYVFVKDFSDDWPEMGVDSLKRYKNSGYDTDALFDKVIDYNGGGGAYLKHSIRDGDQYYMDYFSPTLRARIYIDKGDALLSQYNAKDFDTYEEKAENRTDLMKKVVATLYENGKITEEQYLEELELIDAKPGYNHYSGTDYQQLYMKLDYHYSDEYYDVVVDIR